ncbi:unnamed protein product [Heligmosomoides polygyrus]|uniref:Uncharacterized protein n=1 Tax=Heligmosomoides polygyrus TaxID=6339 RepID=A0A183FQV8_HELPZ|nr:unnamed protein product [Heligmosomoides polygyrus]
METEAALKKMKPGMANDLAADLWKSKSWYPMEEDSLHWDNIRNGLRHAVGLSGSHSCVCWRESFEEEQECVVDEHRVMAVAQPLLELDRLSSKDEDIAPVTQGGTHVNIRPGRVESLKVTIVSQSCAREDSLHWDNIRNGLRHAVGLSGSHSCVCWRESFEEEQECVVDEHRVMAVAQPLLELDRLSSKDEDIAPVTQGGTHVNIRPGRVESLKVVVRVIGALGTRRSAYPLALLAAMESDVEEIRHHAKRLLGVIAENSILKALDSKAKFSSPPGGKIFHFTIMKITLFLSCYSYALLYIERLRELRVFVLLIIFTPFEESSSFSSIAVVDRKGTSASITRSVAVFVSPRDYDRRQALEGCADSHNAG